MAAGRNLKRGADRALDHLSELREAGQSAAAEAEVIALMGHASGHVAARAIKLAAEWRMENAIPAIEDAFERFLTNPLEADKGCFGKLAVVEAFIAMETHRPDIYWRGIRYRQMEPVWGKPEDTAPPFRAACGRALALMGHYRVHVALAELIMDPERVAREGAVSALSWLATSKAELVLHMKVLCGDPEPLVLGECFRTLMTHWPGDAFDQVAAQLASPDPDVVEQAALAIGESRHEEAFEHLSAAYERSLSDVKRALLLPIALVRSDEAFDFVVEKLENGPESVALAALEALDLFKGDEARAARIEAATSERGGAVARAYSGN